MNQQDPNHRVIDEDGLPFAQAQSGPGTDRDQEGLGSSRLQAPFISGIPGMPGSPGAARVEIPQRFLGRDGKVSIWKMLGWRGVLIIALVIGVLVTLALISAAFLLVAIPVLAALTLVGWVARKLTGKGAPQHGGGTSSSRIVVLRREQGR